MREPSVVPNYEEQFKLLRNLGERMANDVKQIQIIVNYLEDKLALEPPQKKSQVYNFVIYFLISAHIHVHYKYDVNKNIYTTCILLYRMF